MNPGTWRYHNPVAVTFGCGELRRLPGLLGGRPSLLVAFPEAEQTGFLAQTKRLLGAGLRGVITDIEPNPGTAWIEKHHGSSWEHHPDCVIVALGGGSTIDCAKLLLTRPPQGGAAAILAAMRAGQAPSVADRRPLIAIPTTAGTGSEVTPWATLWDRQAEKPRKLSLHLQELFAEAAIIDPELTATLPTATTRICALDALSHSFEAIWNKHANPVSGALALKAARTIIATLPAILEAPHDIALRTSLAAASLQAGLAFSNTQTSLAHSISYELTLRHGVPHGIACSFTLPLVWSLARGIDPNCDHTLEQVFGPDSPDGPVALAAFLRSVGVSCDFASYGVREEEVAPMISAARNGHRGRNFIASLP